MIKIYPRLSSIVGATLDRIDVRFSKKLKKDEIGREFLRHLVTESGKSTNNPVKMAKNWFKAYKVNLEKNMMINRIENTIKDVKDNIDVKI